MDTNFFFSEIIPSYYDSYYESYLIISNETYKYMIANININYLLIIFLYSSLLSILCCYKNENRYRLINNGDEVVEVK